jgi:hypothetical protein
MDLNVEAPVLFVLPSPHPTISACRRTSSILAWCPLQMKKMLGFIDLINNKAYSQIHQAYEEAQFYAILVACICYTLLEQSLVIFLQMMIRLLKNNQFDDFFIVGSPCLQYSQQA